MKLYQLNPKRLEGRVFILKDGSRGRFVPDVEGRSVGFAPDSPYYWADWVDDDRALVDGHRRWDWFMFVDEFTSGRLSVIGRTERF